MPLAMEVTEDHVQSQAYARSRYCALVGREGFEPKPYRVVGSCRFVGSRPPQAFLQLWDQ